VTFMALALAGSACASMTPVSPALVSVSSPSVPDRTSPQPGDRDAVDLCVNWLDAVDLDSLPQAAVGEARAAKPVQVLADHQSSLSLCLYVLMGIGLCKTVPSVRKMSLGCIPDWYHDGGPSQVGHSHAVAPDLCFAPVICFIQPESLTEDFTPKYDRGTIAFLLRESLFTPNLLASRGPPFVSY
jgi:hypothetical protein